MSILAFQMWEPLRQQLIAENRFYLEQARKRLLSQFENMEAEAEKAAEEHFQKLAIHFNPDAHDPSEFYGSAYARGIEFYQLLSELRETTRLSIAAGMYHLWDKSLRDWIVGEMRHWHGGEHATREVWKVDFQKMVDFLAAIGFDVSALPCHATLNAMRLVVNVFKHGNGSSLNDLGQSFPEFLTDPLGVEIEFELSERFIDYTKLRVSERHLDQFSEAIVEFWSAVPAAINQEGLAFPAWFERVLLKDGATLVPQPVAQAEKRA